MMLTKRLAAFSLVILLAGPVDAAGNRYNHVSHGPILGRLSADGVGVWARTMRPGPFAVCGQFLEIT